jgi:hypothetical protein
MVSMSPTALGPVPQGLLPATVSGGLSLKTPLERYAPADLWKKINGAADLFLSYGFHELLAGSYARPEAKLPAIEVSIYQMGSDLNSLGIYQAERSEDADRVEVGWEGYDSGDGLFFHKGPYYVKIVDLGADSHPAVRREIARHIDGEIRVEREAIPELEVFPREGLVPGSILYVHRDAFGHGYLQKVFQADYEIGGQTVTLFFCRPDEATSLLAKHREYAREFGTVEREWRDGALRLLSARVFDNSEIVFVRGTVFGGVLGAPDEATALRLIGALLAGIDREQ